MSIVNNSIHYDKIKHIEIDRQKLILTKGLVVTTHVLIELPHDKFQDTIGKLRND